LWDLARERQALLPCLTSLTLELIVYLWSCVWEWTCLWACVWEWACVCVLGIPGLLQFTRQVGVY
jgi:hypothetical protein